MIESDLIKIISPTPYLESAEERAISIHDNESEAVVVSQQGRQGLGVELVITQVERGVDGLERLEIDVDLLLLALLGHDGTTVHNKAIGRHPGI